MPTNLLKEGHQIGWIVSTSKNIFCEWERKKKNHPTALIFGKFKYGILWVQAVYGNEKTGTQSLQPVLNNIIQGFFFVVLFVTKSALGYF